MKNIKKIIQFTKDEHLAIYYDGKRDRMADLRQVATNSKLGATLLIKHRLGML